jgi:hypothetical protein
MINHHINEYHSSFILSICYTIVAKDTYQNKPLCEDIHFNITQYVSSSNSNNLYLFLKQYKGMKVMFIENLYPKFGLINGTVGIVCEIVIDDSIKEKNSTFIEPPLYVVVDFNTYITNHFDLKDINLNGFAKNVIPITPIF